MSRARTTEPPGAAGLLGQPPPLGLLGAVTGVGVGLGLGAGIGLLAGFDPSWGVYHPLWDVVHALQLRTAWLWTGSALAVLFLGAVLLRSAGWLFAHRDAVIVVVVFASAALTGLNIGSRDPFELAFVLAVVFFTVVVLVERRPIVAPLVIVIPLSGLGLCAIASMVNGRVATFFGLPALLTKYVMLLLILNFLFTRRLLKLGLQTFLIVAVLSAVVAIFSQFLFLATGYELTCDDSPEIQHKDTPFGRMLRATAFLPATQTLGHLLIPALALTMLMPCGPIVRWLLACLLLLGTGVTFSTGSIISGVVVFAIALFVRRPQWTFHYGVLLGAAGLAAYATGLVQKVYDAVVVTGSFGLTERVELLRGGYELVQRYPVVGIGVRNSTRVLHLTVHNAYLQMASEAGLAAGALFTFLLVYATVASAASAGSAARPDDRLWLKGLAIGMVGHLVHLSATPLAGEYITFAFMGLVLSAVRVYGRRSHQAGAFA